MSRRSRKKAVSRTRGQARTPAKSRWIIGPWQDLTLIIGSPLFIYLTITQIRYWEILSYATLTSLVMVSQIGHHLPGMMRAYGDPALFARFRIRFILAPILLLVVCTLTQIRGFTAVVTVGALWGWWHYLMQTYGFVRIYDAKVGSFDRVTRYLDQAMCLVWFAAAVVLSDNAAFFYIENFYNSGLSVPSAESFEFLRSLIAAATIITTVLFVANLFRKWRTGQSLSPIKTLLMVSTFSFFWYSTNTVSNILVAYALFELFHDAQYLTIVWAFNRNRVEKDPNLSGFTRFLFQPRIALVGLYLALVFGYGTLSLGRNVIDPGTLYEVVFSVFLMSTLLHYYFDGFIWKLRETDNQRQLGIQSSTSVSSPGIWLIPGVRHAALWCLFGVPVAAMVVTQATAKQSPLTDSAKMVDCTPKSVRAHWYRAYAMELSNDYQGALARYEHALTIVPDYAPAKQGRDRVATKLATMEN